MYRRVGLGWWAARFLAAAGVTGACSDGSGRIIGGASQAGSAGAVMGFAGSAGADTGVVSFAGSAPAPATPNIPNHYPCQNPAPYGNAESGLERCDNPGAGGGVNVNVNTDVLHRVSIGSCAVAAASAAGCVADEDCPAIDGFGSICACNELGEGSCVKATCSSDADCDDGYACLGDLFMKCEVSGAFGGTPFLGFACQGPRDTCWSDGECVGSGDSGCTWMVDGQLDGMPFHTCALCPVGGRPFLVAAAARTAPSTRSDAWLATSFALAVEGLAASLRARCAAHWQSQAEMEHASIAAFARFVLELLSLGAPPELVAAATDAIADETAHARVCYALASAYGGGALGPGKLDVAGALSDLSPTGIVARVVLEGCVGETLAAIEANEAASCAVDPNLREALLRIAEDEGRHAELSWRVLRWALSHGGSDLREVVLRTFREAESALASRVHPGSSNGALDADLVAHGVLPEASRAELALEAFRRVVVPCARALTEAPSRPPNAFPDSRPRRL